MASIPVVSSKAPAADAIACLERAGCVVVRDLFDEDTRERLKRELAPYIEAADVGNTLNEKYAEDGLDGNFYPGNTKRITGLVLKSEMFRGFLTNPLPLAVCDALLKPNCASYHVHATAALVIGPGARVQVLHREEDPFRFVFQLPRPNMVVASMWAITDFTAANGGTLLVPGSHKWPADRKARDEEVVSAEMPAGSVLFWMGGTLHGAGANQSNDWRYGVFLSYSLGWLRQEENQYVDVPFELARQLPKQVRDLVGYKMHMALGYHEVPPKPALNGGAGVPARG